MKRLSTFWVVAALVVPPGATAIATRVLRYPDRYAEVIPGGLYRGAFPSARHIRNLAEQAGIKTVVSLTQETGRPRDRELSSAIRRLGLRHHRFPMPGDGRGDFSQLDRAADALANQAEWPIFFHCAAGKQRSNAVLAAYRMRRCRWTLEQALKELKDKHDLDPVAEMRLVEHLKRYAQWLRASDGIGPASVHDRLETGPTWREESCSS